jgi:hypothetical protein
MWKQIVLHANLYDYSLTERQPVPAFPAPPFTYDLRGEEAGRLIDR